MTLILTELSSFGIAMATDSALTEELRKPDGTIGDKVYYGAQKLFTVPKLRAGIAYWRAHDIFWGLFSELCLDGLWNHNFSYLFGFFNEIQNDRIEVSVIKEVVIAFDVVRHVNTVVNRFFIAQTLSDLTNNP